MMYLTQFFLPFDAIFPKNLVTLRPPSAHLFAAHFAVVFAAFATDFVAAARSPPPPPLNHAARFERSLSRPPARPRFE